MSVSAISSATASPTAGTAGTGTLRVPSKALGQQDFLKLLSVQMTTQDPMNPQKDTDFIAQMAQFNSLEAMQGMQSGLSQLQQDQQTLQATSLLGRTVELQVDKDHTAIGVVSAVKIEAGTPKLIVDNKSYGMGQMISIAPTNQQ